MVQDGQETERRRPNSMGQASNENQAADTGAWPDRPQTDDLADRQEGDQREHVEKLAEELEPEQSAPARKSENEGGQPSVSDTAMNDWSVGEKPRGSRAPG